MSFLKTLAVLAVGFAAAKGVERFQRAGGMAAMQDRLKTAGNPGGMADTFGQMAENMGLTGGVAKARTLATTMGDATAIAVTAGQSGFGALMSAMTGALTGAAASGAQAMDGVLHALPGGQAMAGLSEDQAKLMIRAMIMAANADGTIDPDERARLMAHLSGSTPEELAFVQAEMAAPVDIAGLVAQTDAALRLQVYTAAAMAIRVDTAAESGFLDQLATALGLDAAARAGVHDAAGV